MLTSANILFGIAFLGQIFLISYYFPQKILARMDYVRTSFPRSQYPRLYPKPAEYYVVGRWAFKLATRIILALGFVILFSIIFLIDHATFADDGFISEAFPAAYGVIQFLPLMALEISEFSQFRLMRKAHVATTRTAELRRRGLFNFISPTLLGMTLAMYFGAVLLDLYAHQFEIAWGHDTVQRTMVLTITNLLLAAVGAWILYGKKLSPHQTANDRIKYIKTSLHSFFYVSMAVSVFWMTQAADDIYDLDFLDATIMSVYFQLLILLSIGHNLRNMRLEDIDFDLYKERPAT